MKERIWKNEWASKWAKQQQKNDNELWSAHNRHSLNHNHFFCSLPLADDYFYSRFCIWSRISTYLTILNKKQHFSRWANRMAQINWFCFRNMERLSEHRRRCMNHQNTHISWSWILNFCHLCVDCRSVEYVCDVWVSALSKKRQTKWNETKEEK